MPLDPQRVTAVLMDTLDLSDPAERTAFLDRACGDDQELRQRLTELLVAHERPADPPPQPVTVGLGGATSPLPEADHPDLTVGRTIGDRDQTHSFVLDEPRTVSDGARRASQYSHKSQNSIT